MDIERVLDVYRNGDEETRLALFLGYRELRDQFSLIEQNEETIRSPVKKGPAWLRGIADFP